MVAKEKAAATTMVMEAAKEVVNSIKRFKTSVEFEEM